MRISIGLSGAERLVYESFPAQQLFHGSQARYRMFGGQVGPGKSMGLLMDTVHVANVQYANFLTQTIILRRSLKELERSIIGKFREFIPREMYKSYNATDHIVTWLNNSTTQFTYLENDADAWRYQGAELIDIKFDELTQFPLKHWMIMRGWNRSPHGPGRMAGGTNPIGIGASWVRALFVDHRPAPGMDKDQIAAYRAEDYDFIPASLADNPIYHNTEAGRAYIDSLMGMPTHLRQALLEGRWDILAGNYFDNFDYASMTVRAEEIERRPWWPIWISIDWGFAHNSAVYWHTQSNDGVTYTYRELVENRLGPEQLAKKIVDMSVSVNERGEACKEKIANIYISPDSFAKRTTEDSIGIQVDGYLRRNGMPHCHPADAERIGGWMLMYQMLNSGHWKIARNCEKLIETLPILTRDEDHVEDILKQEGDDPADAARYGIKSRLSPKRPDLAEVIKQRVTATDPTSREIQTMKVMFEERKKHQPFFARRRRRWR